MKFKAKQRYEYRNKAVGWAPGGFCDGLGPYAKVQNCPIDNTELRLTCYATGYADTMFSVPAYTRYKGKYIGGFFTLNEDNIYFVPSVKYTHLLPTLI